MNHAATKPFRASCNGSRQVVIPWAEKNRCAFLNTYRPQDLRHVADRGLFDLSLRIRHNDPSVKHIVPAGSSGIQGSNTGN